MTEEENIQIYLGTMTGTSMDGMDLVAVEINHNDKPRLLHQQYSPYPEKLRQDLQEMALNSNAVISDMCQMDTRLGQFYAEQINQFLTGQKIDKSQVAAIGSHGQTLRHSITGELPYTLQIGDPNIIAARTALTVVADFRRRDIALGGQGAPLAPAFHQQVFRSDQYNRAIINIGGIANITYLPADQNSAVLGFDSGPGNTLMDSLSRQHLERDYDHNGNFGRSGKINSTLLKTIFQQEPYFRQKIPKSTGSDFFSPGWLEQTGLQHLPPADAMATTVELTVVSIVQSIRGLPGPVDECYVCGGGAHNGYLQERLAHHLGEIPVFTTAKLGIDPDWVEAMAFAWLAKQTLNRQPGNLPSVTNAQKFTVLGAVYF